MKITRAVWILDCSVFVEFLDEFLQEHAAIYPWLKESSEIDKTWNWRNFENGLKSKKDELIDWIIRHLLERYYYMDVQDHFRTSFNAYEEIFSKINNSHNLEWYLNQYLPIPKVYPEIPVTYVVTRSCGTLFVQFETEPLIKRAIPRY